MSVFRVDGISRRACWERAKKAAKGHTTHVYEQNCAYLAAAFFSSARPQPISPKYDAPQFAENFKQLALKSGDAKDMQVMCQHDTGEKTPKGAPVLKWLPWPLWQMKL